MKLRNLILPALLTVIGHTASAQQPGSPMITPPLPIDSHAESVASIGNNNIRLSYVRAGEGHQAIACTMQAKVDGRWQYFMSPMEDNKV
ncbi:MAG: hypothetical protein K2F88_02390, partial [Duncaniella sp.]|nr:hypothetical protein [Duncaniella sp.]